MRSLCLLALAALTTLSAAAQSPVLRLTTPAVSLPEPFTRIAAAVELAEGRVLVADDAEQRLVLADLSARSIRAVGRQGSGPGEFRGIGAVLPRPGGAWVLDFALRRVLPIRADGTLENTIPFPASIMARAADAAGVVYGEAFLPRQAVGGLPDSMWILRWDPATPRIDTLMKYDAFVSGSTGGGSSRVMRLFHPADTWTALPGGEILVIDAKAYRLTTFRDGRPVRSVALPWTPVRIGDPEREARRQALSRQRTRVLGQPGAPSGPVPEITLEFPESYPPFGGGGLGGRYTHVSSGGLVWVERLRATSDSIPRYDVVDAREGRLVAQVMLPARSRLVGLGRGSVYVAERDADDIETLTRYVDPVKR